MHQSDKQTTIHSPEPSRHAPLLALNPLRPQQIPRLEILQHLNPSPPLHVPCSPLLHAILPRNRRIWCTPFPPKTNPINAQLAHHPARLDLPVPEDRIAQRRRLDDFHEDIPPPPGFRHARQERRDRGAVDVVPAALALGFEDVALCGRGVGGEGFGFAAGGAVVQRVDGGEGGADAGGGVVGGGQEAGEVRGGRGGEDLLDFLAAG